jgi:hypothetical protein
LPIANQHQQKIDQKLMLAQAGKKMAGDETMWNKTESAADCAHTIRDKRLFIDFRHSDLLNNLFISVDPAAIY